MKSPDLNPLASRLKHHIAELFRLDLPAPDLIPDHAPLIGGSLGLDSLDAAELAISLEEEFGIVIANREESLRAFASIAALAEFIQTRIPAGAKPITAAAAA